MGNLERKLWNGFYSPLWGNLTHEQIVKATDEQIAAWEADFEVMKAHNMPIYETMWARYEAILSNAKQLWGEKSKEYKYLKKTRIVDFDIDYVIRPERRLASYKRDIANYRERQERERREKTRKQQDDADKQLALIKRVEICIRRGFDSEMAFNPYVLMDELLMKDKYLALAHAMQETRNDWRDGFGLVRSALSNFKVETPIDTLIHADIQGCLEENDGDGRIFRDTEWNYSKLFELVSDKTLIDDLRELEAMTNE